MEQNDSKIYDSKLFYDLLKEWCDALISLQITEQKRKELYGGILCPSCARVHGRCGDAIYPMMFLAEATGEEKYLDCAIKLFGWSENMTRPDGSYINDTNSDWKGITVFSAIQLGEAIQDHGHLLPPDIAGKWMTRFKTAADYLYHNIDKIGGNINYPVTCAHAMAVAFQITREDRFHIKARELAHKALTYFTEDGLLYGEGKIWESVSLKNCQPVDLGYNVEESLPALLAYAHLQKDEEVYQKTVESMRIHLEFMLPDGAWDNSWGNRNNKWSYWGSRTSDGCQAGFWLAGRDYPELREAVYRNTMLLKQCTHEGLLYGGPMYRTALEPPCVHHTFCHAKSLAALLKYVKEEGKEHCPNRHVMLPREKQDGIRYFPSVNVSLLARGGFRATISDYDVEYSEEGHASGGSVTMLWHQDAGILLTGTMGSYYLVEPNNMQIPKYTEGICLTPGILLVRQGRKYASYNDTSALVRYQNRKSFLPMAAGSVYTRTDEVTDDDITIQAEGKLADGKKGYLPEKGGYRITYQMNREYFRILAETDAEGAYFRIPIVSMTGERYHLQDNSLSVEKENTILYLNCNQKIQIEELDRERLFHPVGGMEAIPVRIDMVPGKVVELELSSGHGEKQRLFETGM